jgi:hypothetical protein
MINWKEAGRRGNAGRRTAKRAEKHQLKKRGCDNEEIRERVKAR